MTFLYHMSSPDNRASIRKHGLLASKSEAAQLAAEYGEEGGNGIYFSNIPSDEGRCDIWKVNVDGLHLERDETTDHDHLGEEWWVTYSDDVVEPWRLTLVNPVREGLRRWIDLVDTDLTKP